jgi:hypothetical protein
VAGRAVVADHVEAGLGAVGEGGRAAGRALDHVGAGEQKSVVGEGDGRAGAGPAGGAHRQRRHARQQRGGHLGDHPAVRVQGVAFAIHAADNAGPTPVDARSAFAGSEQAGPGDARGRLLL